jgi:hypothetical protein
MIETIYKTEKPGRGFSECYVLVLTSRPASERKVYGFMEEHGHLILAFWFGPPTAVKFGPLGQHWLGFVDGATEA